MMNAYCGTTRKKIFLRYLLKLLKIIQRFFMLRMSCCRRFNSIIILVVQTLSIIIFMSTLALP